jgi:hypothetical protein
VFENPVAFEPAVPTCAQPLVAVLRSILKPVSFDDPSTHVRSIRLEETAVAESPDGATGRPGWVVAEATFEYPESPAPLYARTR